MDLKYWLFSCGLVGYTLLGIAFGALGTSWTNPTISGVNGTGHIALAEDATTMPTLAITDGIFSIISQDPAGVWDIDSASGLMSLTSGNTLDYETRTVYSIVVKATDNTDNAYATVNLTITDVNDNAPTVGKDADYKCLVDRSAASTAVMTLTTTDLDTTTTENAISGWAITASSNPGTYFQISASGAITTAKALNMTAQAGYALIIEAADSDSPKLTGSTTLVVTVQASCVCSGVAITASLMTVLSMLLVLRF